MLPRIAITAGDPTALLSCALVAARAAADEKRWADVVRYLEQLAGANQEPSPALVEALMLLERAQRGLGKSKEADACRDRAMAALAQVQMEPGERVKLLMDLAGSLTDAGQKAALLAHGAVSPETAAEMAWGARRLFRLDVAIGVTGIAGPAGGTPDKPVGLVHMHLTADDAEIGERHVWEGDRIANKERSAEAALRLLIRYVEEYRK
jgi:hypothetical protein